MDQNTKIVISCSKSKGKIPPKAWLLSPLKLKSISSQWRARPGGKKKEVGELGRQVGEGKYLRISF
jgi:hypothetical protein